MCVWYMQLRMCALSDVTSHFALQGRVFFVGIYYSRLYDLT